MGSSLSKIRDDEDDYEYLCKKYGEKEVSIYSIHWDWLKAKDDDKTNLSFQEFERLALIKNKEFAIKYLEKEIKEKQKEYIKLIKEKNELQNNKG